jgi:ABC-type transport system involved in cytochrome c biogenesis permease subunit
MRRRLRMWHITTVHLAGFLMTAADGKTIFRGEIKLNNFYMAYMIILIGIPTLILMTSRNAGDSVIGLAVAIVGLLAVTSFLNSDYQTLLERVRYVISD